MIIGHSYSLVENQAKCAPALPESQSGSITNLAGNFEDLFEASPEHDALVDAIRELGEQGVIELATIMYLGLNPGSHDGLPALQNDMNHRYAHDPETFIIDIAGKTPLKSYLERGQMIYNVLPR